MPVFTYFGYIVYTKIGLGCGLRYTCLTDKGQLAADTQKGMRELIRNTVNKRG